MQIDWWTLALQALNFLVLVWLLWRFLYRPVRDVVEKRKALAEQAFAEAAKKGEEADAARQRYEEQRAGLAEERQDLLKKVHDELEAERGKVLEEAKQEADKLLATTRESLDRERQATLAEIRGEVAGLAADLAAKVLRETSAGAANDVFLQQLEKRIDDLPEEERARLESDVAADGARLTVVTAAPLSDEERARWDKRLADRFGSADNTEFTTDPEILGGAELRFPHAVISFTWAEQMHKAKAWIEKNDAAS